MASKNKKTPTPADGPGPIKEKTSLDARASYTPETVSGILKAYGLSAGLQLSRSSDHTG